MSNAELQNEYSKSAKLKFTVVTVSLNSEQVIGKTIESVLNQTYPPYEYLIFDGLSKDRTVEIAKGYVPLFEQKGIRYTIVSEKDLGAYNAMNKGIRAAAGDFISFLNAGDWYELDALQKIKAFYEEEPFELTYGGIHYVTLDGKVINKMSRLDHFPVSTRHWNHPSMFLKREIYQKYEFDESYPIYADVYLYLRLRKDGTKIRVIDKIIANFVAGNGVSSDTDFKQIMRRAPEKYRAYKENGYSAVYWLECYGWELLKCMYIRLHKGHK